MDPERNDRLARLQLRLSTWSATLGPDADRLAMLEVALLMASADARLEAAEADHIIDTVSYLLSVELDRAGVEAIVDRCGERLRNDGWDARIAAIAKQIADPESRRNAFTLAAAVALIDGWIHRDESRLFTLLSDAFEIPGDEAAVLLDEAREYLGDIDESTGAYRAAPSDR